MSRSYPSSRSLNAPGYSPIKQVSSHGREHDLFLSLRALLRVVRML